MGIVMIIITAFLCLFSVVGCGTPSYEADPESILKVHIVFMNHLDVGFNGIAPELGFINNILNKYFQVYFPRAIQQAMTLEALGFKEKLVYTTHPWLVSLYLDCPPNLNLSGIVLQCPNKTSVDIFKKAVDLGIITWHAGPMNMMFETLMDVSMVEFGLQMSEDLDKMFGITRQHRVLSQRDVPGMTQSLLPIFQKHGIEAITVGVNGVTAPPEVPKIFRWVFQNVSLIGMWHPGGYPDAQGKWPVKPGGMSVNDCVTYPGLTDALCFAFRSDNKGPPESYQEILMSYEIARSQFPNAIVQASNLEDFAAAAQKIKSQLPVFSKEMGDTWIQGMSSDPRKVAEMRAFFRERTNCLNEGSCSLSDPRIYNSSRFLLKVGEHTWGISGVDDDENWTNDKFYPLLYKKKQNFVNGINSWLEQRDFTYLALDALGNHPLSGRVQKAWRKLMAQMPSLEGYERVIQQHLQIKCGSGYVFEFARDGSIVTLTEPKSKIQWASASNPLGQLVYQTYNQTDFDAFDKNNAYSNKFFLGIGKPNLTKNANAESKIWNPVMIGLYRYKDSSQCRFLVNTAFPSESFQNYGAPPDVWITYNIEETPTISGLYAELQWFGKRPTRMPEALLFVFKPVAQNDHSWRMQKLGQFLDPLNVVLNGSQTQHGIDQGVQYINTKLQGLEINSPDVALATMMSPDIKLTSIPMRLTPLTSVSGVAFTVFTNVWDVNFVFWYPYILEDMDQKFRFYINFLGV
ncbi:uncharacterized protein LOC121381225 [Gigantopelta aegis]|uniref:uncharacterized protein LOC121381225 n=1 Tax=Gigantopelta aegis TaxID=1735272 RepID=UPI001B88D188|nr:uncharacterized protein LOC121381225 [Gigantopelta aegis]